MKNKHNIKYIHIISGHDMINNTPINIIPDNNIILNETIDNKDINSPNIKHYLNFKERWINQNKMGINLQKHNIKSI